MNVHEAIADLDFGELNLEDDALVTEAIVIVRYMSPETETVAPSIAWTSNTSDTIVKIGMTRLVGLKIDADTLAPWQED